MNLLTFPAPIADALRQSHWRVLVTGASGWLGQATLELLIQTFGAEWRERVVAFGSRERHWRLRDGTPVMQHPLAALGTLPRAPSLLLHFAYLTREKTGQMPIADYIATNRTLSQLVATAGAAVGVERMFVTSSGAVHAALAEAESPDPTLLYGRLKLEDEALFERFAHVTVERRVFIARLFNLSGPYINKLDSYALASFIQQARQGHIAIHASRPVIRSYTSAANLLGVAFAQLLDDSGDSFVCVETAGDCEVEVQALAEHVRAVVLPRATIDRAPMGGAAADRYVGDGQRYRQLLESFGIAEHSLRQQVTDTADYLQGLAA